MSKSEWGTPAPQPTPKWEWRYAGETTATRREHIATAALQGLLAAGITSYSSGPISVASDAVEYADALIAELDKEQKG